MADLFLVLFFISLICLIVGLINPSIFSRLIKREITRKKIGLIFGVATLVFFILFAIAIPPTEKKPLTEQVLTEQTTETKPEITQPNQEKIPQTQQETQKQQEIQKPENSQSSYPSYTEILNPFSAEANKSFYVVAIPKPEIFPEFLNYLAEKHCPPKKKYPVCVINVYKHPKPEEICLNPDIPWKECEAITIGHWDNFSQPIRWFRDSLGNKINF